MVSTPSPPSAKETAAAQTGANVSTAIANSTLNNVNQVTPDGSLTYNQSGKKFINDKNGQDYYYNSKTGQYSDSAKKGWDEVQGYYVPQYTATQKLSGKNQQIYNETQGTKLGLASLANDQTSRLSKLLGTNVDLSAKNLDKYSNTHWKPAFDKQWKQEEGDIRQQLADQGIQYGSKAYGRAMGDYSSRKQSSFDQYAGDMFNNSMQAILTERNQPINETSALMSGSQMTQPNWEQTNKTNIPTTDVAGLTMAEYQAKQQAASAKMSGLFGLGSAVLGGWASSDRRLKRNIERVGATASGIPLYNFEYVWGEKATGAMADEVALVKPEAVAVGPGGFLMVNYAEIY